MAQLPTALGSKAGFVEKLIELFSKKSFSLKVERLTFAGAIFKPFLHRLFLLKIGALDLPNCEFLFLRFNFFMRKASRRQVGKIAGAANKKKRLLKKNGVSKFVTNVTLNALK